jgi:hypothetical protein
MMMSAMMMSALALGRLAVAARRHVAGETA